MNDPPRILVVDDNEMNRDIIVTRLEANGYKTLQAADGLEALAAVTQHHPDLVLLDVMMLNIDGLEACPTQGQCRSRIHARHSGNRKSCDPGRRGRS